jgi:methanogenic corrinoid protein MtbC1
VLACAPGEQHDLGLLAFGLALRARGWRIVYLGTDTPIASAADAAHASDAVFVVVTAVSVDRFHSHRDELVQLARKQRLFLAGAGAHDAKIGADFETLTGGPVDEAERLTGRLGTT